MKLTFISLLVAIMATFASATEIEIDFDTPFIGPIDQDYYADQGIASLTCSGNVKADADPGCGIKGTPGVGEIADSDMVQYIFSCPTDVRKFIFWTEQAGNDFEIEVRREKERTRRRFWVTLL